MSRIRDRVLKECRLQKKVARQQTYRHSMPQRVGLLHRSSLLFVVVYENAGKSQSLIQHVQCPVESLEAIN